MVRGRRKKYGMIPDLWKYVTSNFKQYAQNPHSKEYEEGLKNWAKDENRVATYELKQFLYWDTRSKKSLELAEGIRKAHEVVNKEYEERLNKVKEELARRAKEREEEIIERLVARIRGS